MKRISLPFLAAIGIAILLSGCSAAAEEAPPPPSSVSPSELNKIAEDSAAAVAAEFQTRYPDLVLPDAKRIKFVTPEIWPSVFASCLKDQGFEATVGKDGGVETLTLPPEQKQPYDLAVFMCHQEYPINPEYAVPLSASQIDYLYSYVSGSLTHCLTRSGVQVSDPPTKQKFQEMYEAGSSWTPYQDIRGLTADEFAQGSGPDRPGSR